MLFLIENSELQSPDELTIFDEVPEKQITKQKSNTTNDKYTSLHGFIAGAGRSGKTIAAMELAKTALNEKKDGKKRRFICVSRYNEWRRLASAVEPDRFRLYSLEEVNSNSLHFNPCKLPKGVTPGQWAEIIAGAFVQAYELPEMCESIMFETLIDLYEKSSPFEDFTADADGKSISEASSSVCLQEVFLRLADSYRMASHKLDRQNARLDAICRLLEHLSSFDKVNYPECRLCNNRNGLGVDDFLQNDEVIILETKKMGSPLINFITNVFAFGVYTHAKACRQGNLEDCDTVMVIENAEFVFPSESKNHSPILDEMKLDAPKYGVNYLATTRHFDLLSKEFCEQASIAFAGRTPGANPVHFEIAEYFGPNLCFDGMDIVHLLPRIPNGWFIITQQGPAYKYCAQEPHKAIYAHVRYTLSESIPGKQIIPCRNSI